MDLSKLPQLEGWISGEVADPRAFPQANVTVGEAAALSLLFWPAFTEYRDASSWTSSLIGPVLTGGLMS